MTQYVHSQKPEIMSAYEGRLRKDEYIVRGILLSTARSIVEQFHYAKSATNTGVYVHGLFKKEDYNFEERCLGIAWWLPPTKNAAIATFPEGDWRKVLSLTRLVVKPDVPKNACSFLLSKSIKLIDTRDWVCLVTYADTWQNHTGVIYKATNWEYLGLTKPSPVIINSDDKMMGRKRGAKNLSIKELNAEGFYVIGSYEKHKYRMILNNKRKPRQQIIQTPLFEL